MIERRVQREVICYLPDKDEPIIVPAELEDDVRRTYIGHPKELQVRIEPVIVAPPKAKAPIPQMPVSKVAESQPSNIAKAETLQVIEPEIPKAPKKKMGRPRKTN